MCPLTESFALLTTVALADDVALAVVAVVAVDLIELVTFAEVLTAWLTPEVTKVEEAPLLLA